MPARGDRFVKAVGRRFVGKIGPGQVVNGTMAWLDVGHELHRHNRYHRQYRDQRQDGNDAGRGECPSFSARLFLFQNIEQFTGESRSGPDFAICTSAGQILAARRSI